MPRRISNENAISMGVQLHDSAWTLVETKKKKDVVSTSKDNRNAVFGAPPRHPLFGSQKKIPLNPTKTNVPPPGLGLRKRDSIISHNDNNYKNTDNNFPALGSSDPASSAANATASPLWSKKIQQSTDNPPAAPSLNKIFLGKPKVTFADHPNSSPHDASENGNRSRPTSTVEDHSENGATPEMFMVRDGVRYMEPRFVYDVNCVVFVGNVASTTTQDMLSSFFSKFGLVKSVNLKNSLTGRNRRDYAFIKFLVPESVQKVLSYKEPLELDGVVLEVRPRAGCQSTQNDTPIPQPIGKPVHETIEEKDTFRTILVENIPQQWSPQFFFQCFTAYGKPTGCFMYDDLDEHGLKKGLIEMSSTRTAAILCQNTGFLLLPNNVTVKLTLTSITDFSGWVKRHSEWMSYQQMWANYRVPVLSDMMPLAPTFGVAPISAMPTATNIGLSVVRKEDVPVPEKKLGVVKASNVDIKAFKNSDEIFKTFQNVFGSISTAAIASIDSRARAVVIFKVPDLAAAKQVDRHFDWYTFPGTPPEIEFP